MSIKIEKINLYCCDFCKESPTCTFQYVKEDDKICYDFKLIDIDIRGLSE